MFNNAKIDRDQQFTFENYNNRINNVFDYYHSNNSMIFKMENGNADIQTPSLLNITVKIPKLHHLHKLYGKAQNILDWEFPKIVRVPLILLQIFIQVEIMVFNAVKTTPPGNRFVYHDWLGITR